MKSSKSLENTYFQGFLWVYTEGGKTLQGIIRSLWKDEM